MSAASGRMKYRAYWISDGVRSGLAGTAPTIHAAVKLLAGWAGVIEDMNGKIVKTVSSQGGRHNPMVYRACWTSDGARSGLAGTAPTIHAAVKLLAGWAGVIEDMNGKIVKTVSSQGGRHNPAPLLSGDMTTARELKLYIENDGELYRQYKKPADKNLSRKWKKGTYDEALAAKGYKYLVEAGAKKYVKDFGGGKWHQMFPPNVRDEVARQFAEEFTEEAKLGNLVENPRISVGRRNSVPSGRRSNPSDIDLSKAGIQNIYDAVPAGGRGAKLWHFQFGAYGTQHVFVWAGAAFRGVDDALEEAASWLADNAPGIFQDVESEDDEVDMTYTESGWIPSWEWSVGELYPGDPMYNKVWEMTIDQLADEDAMDEGDLERVNQFAVEHGIDAEWEMA